MIGFAANPPSARHGVILASGGFQELVTIAPYAVMAYWITPYIQDRPADPIWIEARVEDSNVILRWRLNVEPYFCSYEVYSITAGSPEKLVSPMPLRSAMWVDTAPPPGTRSYAVRAMTASGIRSNLVGSDPGFLMGFRERRSGSRRSCNQNRLFHRSAFPSSPLPCRRRGHKHCTAGLRQTHCHICCIRLIECCTLTQVNLSCRWCNSL